jgi:hypothetical protein
MKRKCFPTDLQGLNAIFDEYYEAFVSCGTGLRLMSMGLMTGVASPIF